MNYRIYFPHLKKIYTRYYRVQQANDILIYDQYVSH